MSCDPSPNEFRVIKSVRMK